VTLHSGRIPVGFGRGIKTRGRPFSVKAHLKECIVEVKAEENCLPHALIIAIAKVDNDQNYTAFRKGRKIHSVDQTLQQETGLDLNNGAEIPELINFQEHFRDYKILVYQGLDCDDIIFETQFDSSKRLNLSYDDVESHYHVIANLTGAMSKKVRM